MSSKGNKMRENDLITLGGGWFTGTDRHLEGWEELVLKTKGLGSSVTGRWGRAKIKFRKMGSTMATEAF